MWNELTAFLTGGGVVALVGAWVGRTAVGHWADRSLIRVEAEFGRWLEDRRASLRREEFLFERQLDAAKAFLDLRQRVTPNYRPEMDFGEAIDDFADGGLNQLPEMLQKFRLEHGVVVPIPLVERMKTLEFNAQEAAYEYGMEGSPELSPNARQSVEEVWTELENLSRETCELVWERPGELRGKTKAG